MTVGDMVEAGPQGPPLPAGAMTLRVSMRGIRKRFGGVEALRGIDVDLYSGECLGLVGDNASGKSTLTKVLSGAYVPDSGTTAIDGVMARYSTPAEARAIKIAMVCQALSLCDSIHVAGNLFLGREPIRRNRFLGRLDKQQMQDEARRMLGAHEIRIPNLSATVAQLSGGQRQSSAIARAVAFGLRVLIMDEPTTALAVAEVEAVLPGQGHGSFGRADHAPSAGPVPCPRPDFGNVRRHQGARAPDCGH